MRITNPEDYTFLRFEIATDGIHKYNGILLNKKTNQEKKIPFGALGYEQYFDKIGHYKEYNHNDVNRRRLYRLRHKGEDKFKFSSGWFSMKFLWT